MVAQQHNNHIQCCNAVQLDVVKEKAATHETVTKKDAFVFFMQCSVCPTKQPVQSHILNKPCLHNKRLANIKKRSLF